MIPLAATGFALSAFAEAIKTIYSAGNDLNNFINSHIDTMKKSENINTARIGTVLEGAKYGFGMGYLSSVTILSVGQYLLGNTLVAATEIATAATLTNPIAMTCAAVGAIYFGWNALSDDEKNHILSKMEEGLQIGKEMVRSIINFVIDLFKNINDAKFIKELKAQIESAAGAFGKSLFDITKTTIDRISKIVDTVTVNTKKFGHDFVDTTIDIKKQAEQTGKKIIDTVQSKSHKNGDSFKKLN